MRLKHRQKKRILLFVKCIVVLCTLCVIKRFVSSPDGPSRMPVYFLSAYTPKETLTDKFNIIHVENMQDMYTRAVKDDFYLFLVLRERAIVSSLFKEYWQSMLASAPSNWDMLQLWTDNRLIQDHVQILDDPWISWMPEHTGEDAFFMTRKGLKKVLNGDGPMFGRGNTYTATRFIIKGDWMFEEPSRVEVYHAFKPDMLIYTTVLLNSVEDCRREYVRWYADWTSVHSDWLLVLVTKSEDVANNIKELWPTESGVSIEVFVRPKGQYNKFEFLRRHVDTLKKYAHFVLKDSDQNVVGFPWRTFIDFSMDSIMSGPLRQTLAGVDQRQWFHNFDAAVWKEKRRNAFGGIYTEETPVLEQYFVRMDGDFASWLFEQLLTDTLLTTVDGNPAVSDWGPDIIWCGAAKAFSPDQPSCTLVPVISKHDDTRQVNHWTSSASRMYENKQQLQKYKVAFSKWLPHDSVEVHTVIEV